MHEAVGNRALIELDVPGCRVRGTFHSPGQSGTSGRIGILFINSLSLPRTASGDSAVHWADAIADRGYPSFRIDLPGLGDSEGEASTDLLDSINDGGFRGVTSALVKALVERFELSGVIIFGHCAGSVTALYAGAVSSECKGLILLDPYFHLPQAKRPRARQELSDWARRSRIGMTLSNVYDRARDLHLFLRGSVPPANANIPLLACWKQAAAAGLPILLLKAPGIKARGERPRVGEFDYIDHVLKLAGRKNRIAVEFIEAADHSFANRLGREAVEHHIEDWLVTHFPLDDINFKAAGVLPWQATEHAVEVPGSQEAPADRFCAMEGR
jgi:alpha-beta hydrolase superfamily lysophospholipase